METGMEMRHHLDKVMTVTITDLDSTKGMKSIDFMPFLMSSSTSLLPIQPGLKG